MCEGRGCGECGTSEYVARHSGCGVFEVWGLDTGYAVLVGGGVGCVDGAGVGLNVRAR